jgi:hypothetical protein
MLLLIIAAYVFYRGAEKRNMIPWLWAVIGVLSYFAGPFLAGIIIGLTDPYSLYDEGAINFYAIISVFVGLIIAYVTMVLIGNNKESKSKKVLLDDSLLDTESVGSVDKLE